MNRRELAQHIIDTYIMAETWNVDFLLSQYSKKDLIWLESVCKSTSCCKLRK